MCILVQYLQTPDNYEKYKCYQNGDNYPNTIFRILHVNTLDRDFGPGPSLNEVLKWWKLEILYGLKTL